MQPFDGPIPGQSLTRTPGNAPYEQPPQFTSVDDAMEFLVPSITAPEQSTRLLAILDSKKISVSGLVEILLKQGFIDQKWNPDLALLLIEPLSALLITLCKQAGVKPVLGTDKPDMKQFFNAMASVKGLDDTPSSTEEQPELPMKGGMMSPKSKFLASLNASK